MFGRKKKIIINDKGFIPLTLQEAYTRDVGNKTIRVDYDVQDKLFDMPIVNIDPEKIFPNDTAHCIEMRGTKSTAAIMKNVYPSDDGKGIVRVDGMDRNNCNVGIGDEVWIRKIEIPFVKSITVKPLESIPPLTSNDISSPLNQKPLTKRDFFMIPYFGGRITFQVKEIENDQIAMGAVDQNTSFKILDP